MPLLRPLKIFILHSPFQIQTPIQQSIKFSLFIPDKLFGKLVVISNDLNKAVFTENGTERAINRFEVALEMFQLLHMPLVKLKVIYTNVPDGQRHHLSKCLARYCYDSLKVLQAIDCDANDFRSMIRKVRRIRSRKVFKKFKNTSGNRIIKSTYRTQIQKTLSMFPRLRKLILVNCNIPHKTLQLFKRIRSLEIWYPSFDYLIRYEAQPFRLPRLKNFTLILNVSIIIPNVYTNFPIDLSLVEHFAINDEANNRIDHFIRVLMYNLASLRTLDLVGVTIVFSIELLYEYMGQMVNLESLGLITMAETTYDELQEFICDPNFFNIKTFRLNLWEHVDYEEIVQFLFALKPECGSYSYDEHKNHVISLVPKTDFRKYFRNFDDEDLDYYF